ncbi:hypothetical protein [Ensifer aridi]|uniref:hypothetical protein n=1 Tax=Ensifer aridi TaxID=1708715 RepID=UPI000A103235|nr:hypothetical protein [Ensifer aridi]
MHKILTFFAVTICVSHAALAQNSKSLPYEKAPYNDTIIQCGALFALVAQGYKELGEAEKARAYKAKFDSLVAKSKEEFERIGRSGKEAEDLLQERIYLLNDFAERDADFALRLIGFCDQRFPM